MKLHEVPLPQKELVKVCLKIFENTRYFKSINPDEWDDIVISELEKSVTNTFGYTHESIKCGEH